MRSVLRVRADVAEAIERGSPVVALESTLIAHGLPYPDNLDLAREVEAIVRAEGAVPATIGVVGGVASVGLDDAELALMASAQNVVKLSARDLPIAVATESHGATTVAATAYLAARCSIRLFATGGLGGVHRQAVTAGRAFRQPDPPDDAREAWDVSADLVALSRTPVAVVCAGVKSILDISATLELLESLGVPVVGYRTQSFPRFYVADSGYPIDWYVDSPAEAARVIENMALLGMSQMGLIIANPIPENEQLDPKMHDDALDAALHELRRQGIHGKEVTPFLLRYFAAVTGGESVRVNKQIIRNNARLAAHIARALAEHGAERTS